MRVIFDQEIEFIVGGATTDTTDTTDSNTVTDQQAEDLAAMVDFCSQDPVAAAFCLTQVEVPANVEGVTSNPAGDGWGTTP